MELHIAGKKGRRLALWGGLECTINRVGEAFHNQLERSGHEQRPDDIARFCALGMTAIRYPILWERVAPNGLDSADWRWTDQQVARLQGSDVSVIAGLVHHGSGPANTSLLDDGFVTGLAAFAAAVAQRYPGIEYYTPVNEPLTTARFSGLYGFWYPHGKDDQTFLRALLVQCRATVLSMRAIRAINPKAKLVQTDDLGKTTGTPAMAKLAEFYNHRRWLGWDLLCGMVGPEHALWKYLIRNGIGADDIFWFKANPCPPDIIGANYYVTSERWLDHRAELYPPHQVGRDDRHRNARGARGRCGADWADAPVAGIVEPLPPANCCDRGAHRRWARRPVALAARDLARR